MSTPTVTVGDHTIGAGNPCYVIAEIGINHNGELDNAKKLIDVAAEAGIWPAGASVEPDPAFNSIELFGDPADPESWS